MFKLLLLVQALLIKVIASQCICNENISNFGGIVSPKPGSWPGIQACQNLPYNQHLTDAPVQNYGLTVTSSSPFGPGILSITSENVIEGPISICGELPFLSAVAFDGSMPTCGYGGVAYGCGDGTIGIFSETSGLELPGYELPGRPGMEVPSYRPGYGRVVDPRFPQAKPVCGCH